MSRNREHKVENLLHDEITAAGGTTRKWVGRIGEPDRIVIINGFICFVEAKTTTGSLSAHQRREHERLRSHGATVFVCRGREEVAEVVEQIVEMSKC